MTCRWQYDIRMSMFIILGFLFQAMFASANWNPNKINSLIYSSVFYLDKYAGRNGITQVCSIFQAVVNINE